MSYCFLIKKARARGENERKWEGAVGVNVPLRTRCLLAVHPSSPGAGRLDPFLPRMGAASLPHSLSQEHPPPTLLWELFSAPFPLQALSSPSEPSAILHIIRAGIKYNCVWKVQKSKLALGIFSVSPVELKTGVSLKRYVFRAAGVLICKAHYSNKTLKQSSISQCSGPVSSLALASPARVFLSSFRAQSWDLSIGVWT